MPALKMKPENLDKDLQPYRFVTISEAEALGYGSASTLRNLIREGLLPARQLPVQKGRIIIRLSDLEDLYRPIEPVTTGD